MKYFYSCSYFGSVLYSLLFCLNAHAQEDILYFKKLSAEQGLSSQTYNHFVFQDSKKFIWVNSLNGLNRYDGIEVKRFQPDELNPLSLSDPIVQSEMMEDSKGRIWFNTTQKIQYFDPLQEAFYEVPVFDSLDNEFTDFQVIYLDSIQDQLWFLANIDESGEFPLYIFDIESREIIMHLDNIPLYAGYSLETLYLGNDSYKLFIPLSNGWEIREYSLNLKKPLSSTKTFKKPGFRTNYFFIDDFQKVWIGTEKGLMSANIEGSDIKFHLEFEEKRIQEIAGVTAYDSSSLLIATRKNGLFLFNKKTKEFEHSIQASMGNLVSPFGYSIQNIYKDNDENLWISSYGQGVFYTSLVRKRFDSILQRKFIEGRSNNVISLTEGPENNLWCVTNDGIIISQKNGSLVQDIPPIKAKDPILNEKNLFFISSDAQKNIWTCGQKGLFVLKNGNNSFKAVPNNLSLGTEAFLSTYFYQLKSGLRLVSTYSKGVQKIQTKNGFFEINSLDFRKKSTKLTGRYSAIYEDNHENVFFTQLWNSIKVFQVQEEEFILTDSIAFKPMVTGWAEDTIHNRIWIASSQGLYFLEKRNNGFHLTKDDYFSKRFNSLNGILLQNANNLWLSSNQGLILYNPYKDQKNHESNELRNDIFTFGLMDGLQGLEFNFWAYEQTKNKEFIFGGTNGLSIFYPEKISRLPIQAHPSITSILINGELTKPGMNGFKESSKGIPHISLSHAQKALTLQFSSMQYGGNLNGIFRYYLKNDNSEILNQGKNNPVQYFNLDPGKYTFELFAANSESIWNPTPNRLSISISPHWSQSWWFLTIVAFLIAGILYAIYRNRMEHLRKQQQITESKMLLAETENAVLRTQMNPHFIFNSLNSIRSYIQDKDTRTADDYLVESARFMRKIMEIAPRHTISLSDEMELLTAYMDLEKKRFDDGFLHEVSVPEEVDPDDYILPTMLLQPFVENAIIHGFHRKKGIKKIGVRFWLENEMLHCAVRDNGLGRKVKDAIPKQHKSKALEITQNRLKIIEEKTNKKTSLNFIDHKDILGNPSGTEVIVSIPIL